MTAIRALNAIPPVNPAPTSDRTGTALCRPVARRTGPTWLLLPVLLFLLLAGAGCRDDLTGPFREFREVGVVVNSIDVSLSLFDIRDPDEVRTVGLAADGSPVGLSVREDLAAVPLGLVPAVAVVDLRVGEVVRTIALPEGSGATGSAFVDDSVVVVGNPSRNSVTPVNVLRGTTGEEIAVGRFPQHVLAGAERVFVINAELGPDFEPDGPGTVTVLDRETLEVEGTVTLSGENPGDAVLDGGVLFVLNSGRFGEEGGSLSVVDPEGLAEVAHHPGFGSFPSSIAVAPVGFLYVSSFFYGISVWDPGTATFVRPPENAIAPLGVAAAAGVGVDIRGNLYALETECAAPGSVFVLSEAFQVSRAIDVGTCPVAIVFGRIFEE